MIITIAICTFNRNYELNQTLNLLSKISTIQDCEILIIDNNSKDKTREVVEYFRSHTRLNVVYVVENKQGIAHARNKAVKEATGDIIAFIDDDVSPTNSWLETLTNKFKLDNTIDVVFGRILPIWPNKKKYPWLSMELSQPLALLDYGEQEFIVYDQKYEFYSANLAIKKVSLEKINYTFNVSLGRKDNVLLSGEESELFRTVLSHDWKIVYSPAMVVYHRIDPKRLLKKYMHKWYFYSGVSIALQNNKVVFKDYVVYLKFFFEFLSKWIILVLLKRNNAFRCKVEIFRSVGYFYGKIFNYKYRNE